MGTVIISHVLWVQKQGGRQGGLPAGLARAECRVSLRTMAAGRLRPPCCLSPCHRLPIPEADVSTLFFCIKVGARRGDPAGRGGPAPPAR